MIGQRENIGSSQTASGRLERQKAFGWTIALAIFLGGSGGGIFLVSYILYKLYKYQTPVVQAGLTLGPLVAMACALCFLLDLGNKARMPRLFAGISRLSSSWLSRGAWTLTVFILLGAAYSLLWNNSSLIRDIVGFIAALAALVTIVYTGFLIGVAKSIPFWNTPLLPILFVASGLGSGIAALLLMGGVVAQGQEAVAATRILAQTGIALIVAELIMLWAYLGISVHRDQASAESVRLIKIPMVLIIAIGLLTPIAVLIYTLGLSDLRQAVFLESAAALLELAGALFLRFSILNAGVYLRIQEW